MQQKNLLAIKSREFKSKNFVRKTAKVILLLFFVLAVFLFVQSVSAVTLEVGLEYAGATGLGTSDIRVTIARVIRVALGFLGVVAVALVLYGGYAYMTSVGNPEKVDRAKKILRDALIGLLIILSAVGIATFILNYLLIASGLPGLYVPPPYGSGGGALGSGIIESHYPARGARNIPRNTWIAVTFKESMCVNSIVNTQNPDFINTDTVRIHIKGQTDPVARVNARAYYSANDDFKSFVFVPEVPLGNAVTPTDYTVELTNNITKFDCSTNAFGIFEGYDWTFQVSTVTDVTPPRVVAVFPRQDDEEPRNVVIHIDFNEPINPLTISGQVKINGGGTSGVDLEVGTFDRIVVQTADSKFLAGRFFHSNAYKSSEFVTNDLCGKNTCGGDVFCLPANEDITTTIKANDVPVNPLSINGVVDMAGNSLDGSGDGVATGPATDNYVWNFSTTDEIRLNPPEIKTSPLGYLPGANQTSVSTLTIPSIYFNSLMMTSTLKSDSGYNDGKEYITLYGDPALLQSLGYAGGGIGYEIHSTSNYTDRETTALIWHDRRDQLAANFTYDIRVGSGLKDVYQNCYNPCAGPGCVKEATEIPGIYQVGDPWTPNAQAFPSCQIPRP